MTSFNHYHLFSLPGTGSWGEQPTNITSRGFQSPWTSQSAKTQGKRSFLMSKEIHGWCSWMLTNSLFFHFLTFYTSSKNPQGPFFPRFFLFLILVFLFWFGFFHFIFCASCKSPQSPAPIIRLITFSFVHLSDGNIGQIEPR